MRGFFVVILRFYNIAQVADKQTGAWKSVGVTGENGKLKLETQLDYMSTMTFLLK